MIFFEKLKNCRADNEVAKLKQYLYVINFLNSKGGGDIWNFACDI